MVAHLMAAGMMAAATLGATQDCDTQSEHGGDRTAASTGIRPVSERESDDAPKDDEEDHRCSPPNSIRLIAKSSHSNAYRQSQSEKNLSYRTPDGAIRLMGESTRDKQTLIKTSALHDVALDPSSSDAQSGYVHGNFSAGKVRDVKIRSKSTCYAIASHPLARIPLLAVGLSDGLAFYERRSFSMVHTLEMDDMVSALSWVVERPPSNHGDVDSLKGNLHDGDSLLVMGTLDGWVSVFLVNYHILETQGPTLLYRSSVPGQVRALTSCYVSLGIGSSFSDLLVACGTKKGCVALLSWDIGEATRLWDGQSATPIISRITHESSAVLGLDVNAQRGLIAWSTKAGQVVVHQLGQPLCQDYVSKTDTMLLERVLWYTQRQGPVRSVLFSKLQPHLIFGGYDKTVVIVDTEIWAICRQLTLHGTVNTVSLDARETHLTVGSRDKTFRVFDTSTYANIKSFQTPGWVTSISWLASELKDASQEDQAVVAIRSDNSTVSILNLSPIALLDTPLSSSKHEARPSGSPSLSWTSCGRLMARSCGTTVVLTDSTDHFSLVGSVDLRAPVLRVSFCPAVAENRGKQRDDVLAAVDESGTLRLFSVHQEDSTKFSLRATGSCMVEEHVKALAWAPDGNYTVIGGRSGKLHFIGSKALVPIRQPLDLGARIWEIDFAKVSGSTSSDESKPYLAVALGDYTAVILNGSFDPILRVIRSRTARCLNFHPALPLLAVGDGEGVVSVVDYSSEELVKEFSVHGRVNTVKFSPVGDKLLVGTDDCLFQMHELGSFENIQTIETAGFASTAEFSPSGAYLALGSTPERYKIVRLGPLLSIDLVPIGKEASLDSFPPWVLQEVLFRSGYGPSFVQRHMIKGGQDNLAKVAEILRLHSDALYAFNRKTGEGCFDTALALKRPSLLKLAVTMLVDGTLDDLDGQNSILTTTIPLRGRNTLMDFINNYPPDFIVSILHEMAFTKVPFTSPHDVEMHNHRRLECSSSSFLDPWSNILKENQRPKHGALGLGKTFERTRGHIVLTPAVLPLPGLGDLEFLSSLLANAPPHAFDNDAMSLVLGVVWRDHIRKFFVADCFIFSVYYASWVVLLELIISSDDAGTEAVHDAVSILSLLVVSLNSLFLAKEIVQSGFGKRKRYFLSIWNWVDVSSILCIYIFVLATFVTYLGVNLIPLAVITTLLLTIKLLSYMRGFKDTGWLVSVLIANFRDVRGFLLILCSILLGFSVTFRVIFADSGDASFETLRSSFLSTFEMTILGTYNQSLLSDDIPYRVLATITFVLAVTCVLVVALNALISILADSYAKVQEHAAANRMYERAALIVEYMVLLPSWQRHRIEQRTKWFHVLLEVDAQDNLLVKKDDWEGGLNVLRREIQGMEERVLESNQKAIEQMKSDLDSELMMVKKDLLLVLSDLSDEIQKLQVLQTEGGIRFSGKNVAKAVKAVKSLQRKGEAIFKPK